MRFLREHLFYVALIAVTVLVGGAAMAFYVSSDIGAKVKSRQDVSDSLYKLARAQQKINQQAVDALKTRNEAYQAAGKKAVADSVEFNRKNLKVLVLSVRGSEPKPAFPIDAKTFSEKGLTYEFILQYNRSLDELAALGRRDLGRTVLPTREETQEQEAKLKEQWKDQAGIRAIESMKVRKARDGRVYIDDGALDRYFPRERTTAQFFELWESQVNLWVTQEVLQAIAVTNQGLFDWRKEQGVGPTEESVLTSAVKRLEKLSINEAFVSGPRGAGGDRSGAGLGGRGTNDQYGVIRYQFVVVMPPRYVERLLRTLMLQNYHNAMVTSMSEIPPRERGEYYYGVEPVMRVEIDAEMLLLLEWAKDKMPDDEKARLAQAQGQVGT
jgi:hypothetical protein